MGRTMGTAVGGGRAVPRYVQIADEVVQQIRAGVLKPGDMVPSESELVERYGVSGGTIRKAMVEVRASGLVETRHGKGSIVKDRPPVRLVPPTASGARTARAARPRISRSPRSPGPRPRSASSTSGPMEVPEEIAERLGVEPGTQVLARRRLYFRNGTPVETATLVPAVGRRQGHPGTLRREPRPRRHLRPAGRRRPRLRRVRRDACRRARPPRPRPSELALSPGAPVVHLVRDAVTEEGRVVEVCDTLMAADQFVFELPHPCVD